MPKVSHDDVESQRWDGRYKVRYLLRIAHHYTTECQSLCQRVGDVDTADSRSAADARTAWH